MHRQRIITIATLIITPFLVGIPYAEKIWDLSSLNFLPIVIITTAITIISTANRKTLLKLAEGGSEPIVPYYRRRGDQEKPGILFRFVSLALPGIGIFTAGMALYTQLLEFSVYVGPGYVCYIHTGCTIQTVLIFGGYATWVWLFYLFAAPPLLLYSSYRIIREGLQ
jgi:hypothetical protein